MSQDPFFWGGDPSVALFDLIDFSFASLVCVYPRPMASKFTVCYLWFCMCVGRN